MQTKTNNYSRRLALFSLTAALVAGIRPTSAAADPVTQVVTVQYATGAVLNEMAINFASSKLKLNSATLESTFQPLNGNLTSIGALSTTSFGRGALTAADASAFRTYIGAGTSSFSGAFSALSGKPTTLSGYGITDALSAEANNSIGGDNTFSGENTFQAGSIFNGLITAAGGIDLAGHTLSGLPNPSAASDAVSLSWASDAANIGSGTLNAARLPSVVVKTTDTGTVTNTMLAGSIANAKLSNSAVTISGHSLSLGGSLSLAVADVSGAVANTVTVNGHALSTNVTVTKSDLSLGSVENTALSTWAGSSNLTTLGTIGTGTWSATAIAVTKGGTGATSASAARTALDVPGLSSANAYTGNQTMTVSDGAGFNLQFNIVAANHSTAIVCQSVTDPSRESFVSVGHDTLDLYVTDAMGAIIPAGVRIQGVPVNPTGGSTGDVLTKQADGSLSLQAPAGGVGSLAGLSDVALSSPADGEALLFDSDSGFWFNGMPTAAAAWGAITGTLSDQTDLQTALDSKPTAVLDTDGTLAANDDAKVASQKAVKTYVDAALMQPTLNVHTGVTISTDTTPVVSTRPVFVTVSVTMSADPGNNESAYVIIASVSHDDMRVGITNSGSNGGPLATIVPVSFWVPPGATYNIHQSSGAPAIVGSIAFEWSF